ncbi:MAG: hypothetical protein H0V64_15180 [Geodermatophilaceae bacterium]|nr:hypothetical protein [Geodermatophilaceae bacterium]
MGGPARQLLTAVLLSVLVAGCGGTVSGQGSYLRAGPAVPSSTGTPSTGAPTSGAPTTGEPTESTSAEPSPTTENTSTSAAPTTASATSAPPPPSEEFDSQGWVVESVEFSSDILGNFQGIARINNTADIPRSALFTFSLFKGEDLVAALIGSVTEVPPGDTVTVQLIGLDPFVEGPYSIDFQVDFTF